MVSDRTRSLSKEKQLRYKDRYDPDNASGWHYVFNSSGREIPISFPALSVGVYEKMMRDEFGGQVK